MPFFFNSSFTEEFFGIAKLKSHDGIAEVTSKIDLNAPVNPDELSIINIRGLVLKINLEYN
jgi:hypothetical protein